MTPVKSIFLGAALLVGATTVANAQAPFPSYAYGPVPPGPPSWSYDPYTSGLSPCPTGSRGYLGKCGDRMPATYGQPDYAQHTYPQPGYYYQQSYLPQMR
jgi:hypothetical protein